MTTHVFLKRDSLNNDALRAGQTLVAESNGLSIYIGKDSPYALRHIQKAGRAVDQLGVVNPALSGDWTFDEQWAFQLGYSRYKKPGKITLAKMSNQDSAKFQALSHIWNSVRDMINTGPSQLPPLALAERAEALIREFAGDRYTLKVEKIVGEDLLTQGYVGCYYVGRGSEFTPVLLSIKIYPKGQENKKIEGVMVGKGITFDSGGYIIKPRDGGIAYMKADMGGAATVTGAMALNLFEGINKPVELILCCAENMVSSTSYRPGDILTYKNGVKVEIVNTDAEGRVVLADGLIKAQAEHPKLIINAATLTGAAKVAVGGDYSVLFSRDSALRERALADAQSVNEGLWPLPLETWHQDAFPSLVADTMNADVGPSASPAASANAAGFLSRFVEPKQKWLHYDLSSAYMVSGNSMWPGGSTGLMIRSIAETFKKEI